MKRIIVAAALLAGGCASTSPGRYTTLEWDSRSPEQITAAAPMDTAVYTNAGGSAKDARGFDAWTALFDMISGLRVRIRLVTVEWGPTKETK